MTRERLLEVYSKEQVDQLIPFNRNNMFPFNNEHTITDEELDRIGLLDLEAKLYEMPEELIHKPHKTLKDKIEFNT